MRRSWELLLAQVPWDRLGARLYETIFTKAPELEEMFSKSSVAMGIKMVDMIDRPALSPSPSPFLPCPLPLPTPHLAL